MNPIIAKIEKVLRLAASTEGTPEGETAARLAAKLMAAHQIEIADIDLDREVEDDPIEARTFDKVGASNWRRQLFHILAKHCSATTGYRGKTVTVYGHRSDVEVCAYLYDICRRQIDAAAKAYLRLYPHLGRSGGNDFRRSAVAGLSSKLRAIRADVAREESEGSALVRCRGEKVDRWVADNFTFGRARRVSYRHSPAGWQAGRKVSLNAGVKGASTRSRSLTG